MRTALAWEHDLFTIDGPMETWSKKKALRHRVQRFSSRLSDITFFDPDRPLESHSKVWLPIEPFDSTVAGQTVAVCRDYQDDSEPRLTLSAWVPASLAQIDSEGDYELCFESDARHAWIFKDRVSLLRKLLRYQTVLDDWAKLESDCHAWKDAVT